MSIHREKAPFCWRASIETVCCAVLSVLVAVVSGTWWHIAVAAAFAPMLLLRSSVSDERSYKWFRRTVIPFRRWARQQILLAQTYSERQKQIVMKSTIAFYYLCVFSLSLLIRALSVATTLGTLAPYRAIPHNWYRMSFVTRVTDDVEIVPGYGVPHIGSAYNRSDERIKDALIAVGTVGGMIYMYTLMFQDIAEGVPLSSTGLLVVIACTVCLSILILIFMLSEVVWLLVRLVPIWYRLSLKSTFVVWFPLVYVFHRPQADTLTAVEQVKRIKESAWELFVRRYSAVVIALLSFKFVVSYWFAESWNKWIGEPLGLGMTPYSVPLWQILAYVLALSAWGIYFWADAAYFRLTEAQVRWSAAKCANGLVIYRWVTGVVSIYTSLSALYLVCATAFGVRWDLIEVVLLPWQ